MLITPPSVTSCYTFSDPSPLSSVAYFMDGPHAMAFKGAKQIGALTSGERGQLLLWS